MSAAADPPLPSPTPSSTSRRIPGHTSILGYLSEEIQAGSSAMALSLVSGGQTNSIGFQAASSAVSGGQIHSLADLHQEMRATTALLKSGLDSFSAHFHDTIPVDIQQQARELLALARSYLDLAQSIVDTIQAQHDTTSHILSSALRNMSTKATRFTPPGALPTCDEYAAGLPALAYGVLERANQIISNLLVLAPADCHTPVEDTVVDFIRGTKESLDNTLQQILLWKNLGKDLLLGEKEKSDKHVNELQQQLQDLKLELIRSNLGKDLVLGEKEKSDKHSEDLQHRLLDLQLEMCGLKRELKDAQAAGEKYEDEICCLMGDLEDAQKDAQKWKITAEEKENEICGLKRDLKDTQGDGEKWKQAAEEAAKNYEEKEKAPYVAKAEKLKAEYTKKMDAYNNPQAGGPEASGDSDKSKSEINDEEGGSENDE